ncbi:MAG: hypothetical protein J7483_08810 [Novosphingobium sp.]|nr:hypothetical protein [Novosphingobium sp.]
MTPPSVVFFGHDGDTPKVFVRCLLYSTSTRGQLVQHMYASVKHGDETRLFTFWGYGEANALSAGSGLFVSKNGIALNHHFVMSVHAEPYSFEPGHYSVEIFAKVVRGRRPVSLGITEIDLSPDQAKDLRDRRGILFERDPIADTFKGEARPDPTNRRAVAADRAMREIEARDWVADAK